MRKLVFTSSAWAVWAGQDFDGVDESQTPYLDRYLSPYGPTKAAAEREVLAANSELLRTVSLRPNGAQRGVDSGGMPPCSSLFFLRLLCLLFV